MSPDSTDYLDDVYTGPAPEDAPESRLYQLRHPQRVCEDQRTIIREKDAENADLRQRLARYERPDHED